jgi:hypothetical protein
VASVVETLTCLKHDLAPARSGPGSRVQDRAPHGR